LASSLCQWVVMAPHCGPGGEFLMLHISSDREVMCYAGWARTPYHLSSSSLTAFGPAAAVVPGALRGAEAASSSAGKLPWFRLFEAALAAADGHKCTEYMASEYRKVVQRGHATALEAVFGTAHAPSAGDLLRAPALRETLAAIATRGADDFYHGGIAARLLAGAARDGAALSEQDLTAMSAEVRHVGGQPRGDLDVYVTPWPSQAPIVLDLLSAVDVAAPPTSTVFAEAVAALTEQRLTERCTVGLPGTAVSMAADEDRAAAVVVHSLSGTQFGSGWVPEGTGVAFSNRVGTALANRPDLPGAHPQPGAPLPHTLSAAHVRTADGRDLTMATPGGDRQIQWLAQAVQGVGLGLHANELVGMPRWFVCPEGESVWCPRRHRIPLVRLRRGGHRVAGDEPLRRLPGPASPLHRRKPARGRAERRKVAHCQRCEGGRGSGRDAIPANREEGVSMTPRTVTTGAGVHGFAGSPILVGSPAGRGRADGLEPNMQVAGYTHPRQQCP
jgi:gamma-glutamyltranspeptidase